MDLKIFAIAVTFYAEAEVGVLFFTDLKHLLIIVHFDKFCLSFENSLCSEYITEKLWYGAIARVRHKRKEKQSQILFLSRSQCQ